MGRVGEGGDLCLVEIHQELYGQHEQFWALAIKAGDRWMWYPNPRIQLGEGQTIKRWVRVDDIEGWREL